MGIRRFGASLLIPFGITVGLLVSNNLMAQYNLGHQVLTGVIQMEGANPALMIDRGWALFLPASFADLRIQDESPFKYLKNQGSGLYRFDLQEYSDHLGGDAGLIADTGLRTIGFGIRSKNNYFSFGHQFRMHGNVSQLDGVFHLLSQGNATALGETIEIGPRVVGHNFSEFNMGWAHSFGALSAGLRLKLMSGILGMTSDSKQISLYTDPEYYQLTVQSDYALYSNFDLDNEGDSTPVTIGLFENFGVGLDLGLQFVINDRLNVGVSVLDIGSIKWNNGHSYSSQGTFQFDGYAMDDLLKNDNLSFPEIRDTIEALLGFEEGTKDFNTKLPTRFIAQANYQVLKWLGLSAVVQQGLNDYDSNLGFVGGTRFNVGKRSHVNTYLAFKNEVFGNLGLGGDFLIGNTFQFYFYTDNIIAYFDKQYAKNLNFNVGINLLLNQKTKMEEPARIPID